MNQLTYLTLSGANISILADIPKKYEINPGASDQAWLYSFEHFFAKKYTGKKE